MKTKYKYCVQVRFSSELYTQKEWLTSSWHVKLEEANIELDRQIKHGGKYIQARICPT